jgi:hypothetical protein
MEEFHNNSDLLRLPKDVIKLIISYCHCPQWFTLCKELTTLALQVISPLDHRTTNYPFGALEWATSNNKILAVASLLQGTRIILLDNLM